MSDIRLIERDTDISKLNMMLIDWDVVVYNRPYQLAFIEGYVHSIGGKWGHNNIWMWPRGKQPTYDNLVQYSGSSGACWGYDINLITTIRQSGMKLHVTQQLGQ